MVVVGIYKNCLSVDVMLGFGISVWNVLYGSIIVSFFKLRVNIIYMIWISYRKYSIFV